MSFGMDGCFIFRSASSASSSLRRLRSACRLSISLPNRLIMRAASSSISLPEGRSRSGWRRRAMSAGDRQEGRQSSHRPHGHLRTASQFGLRRSAIFTCCAAFARKR